MSKYIKELNNTTNQVVLTKNYRALYSVASEYSFFSTAHEMFIKKDHMLSHKMSLDKLKNIWNLTGHVSWTQVKLNTPL